MSFNVSHHWVFPSNNCGQISGIGDSGIETFKGTPIKSLAREICQNSLDACVSSDTPVNIEFRVFDIDSAQTPDCKSLENALMRAQDFWSLQRTNKARVFFKTALSVIRSSKITCLRISDFNTTGLTGSREEYNSPWCNLTKSQGASDKSGANGGSFGIGKFAPFACSALRTVIYSTSDRDGMCAYQGISRLTSFKNEKNEITQGMGFYGNANNAPVLDSQFSLDPNYSRDDSNHGTDIFILGFTDNDDWKAQMIASILDGFLYAVYSGMLTVDVDGVIVNKDTLPELMGTYKPYFQNHADEYYQVLIDEKARVFEKELSREPDLAGKLTLKMLIMSGFHRRVAMIRQTGMKIKDKGNISGLIPFAGVLYIEGDAINSYLRSLENPQHLEWEIERADNKAQARRLLTDLTKFIKSCLDEMKNDDSEETLDPSVGEYLSAIPENAVENQEKVETIKDTIQGYKVRVAEPHPKPSDLPSNISGTGLVDNEKSENSHLDVPGDTENGGDNSGHAGGGGKNHGGVTDLPIEHNQDISTISISNVRCIVRNKTNGEYSIVFTPTSSAVNGFLEIFMVAESQNYEALILSADCADCPNLSVKKNRIRNLILAEGKTLRVNIKLDYHDYCSLEVKVYGNQA